MSQFPDDLEAQLRRAAQRVHAGAEPAPRLPRRSGRLRRVLRAAPVLAAVGVTVALAVAVLVLVGHGRRSVSAPGSPPPSGLGGLPAQLLHPTAPPRPPIASRAV